MSDTCDIQLLFMRNDLFGRLSRETEGVIHFGENSSFCRVQTFHLKNQIAPHSPHYTFKGVWKVVPLTFGRSLMSEILET